MFIQASQLQVGSIIDHVEGNPNIRGTVTQVNRFGTPVANKDRRSPSQVQNKDLRPLPLQEARIIAKEVEDCYGEDNGPSSITVKIGANNINLRADTPVSVWVPAADVMHALYGR